MIPAEICIYMQPKVGCKSKKIESTEVLVRWNKAPGVVWTPDKFLPVLEEYGNITMYTKKPSPG